MNEDALLQEAMRGYEYVVDPVKRKHLEEKQKERIRWAILNEKDAESVISDIHKIGYRDVFSISWFVNTSSKYPEIIHILTKHLDVEHRPAIRSSLVRALTVKEAQGTPAMQRIVQEYKEADDRSEGGYKWVCANALTVATDYSMIDELIALALHDDYDDGRVEFVRAIKRFKSPKVKEALEQLAKDDSERVSAEAKKALRTFRIAKKYFREEPER